MEKLAAGNKGDKIEDYPGGQRAFLGGRSLFSTANPRRFTWAHLLRK